MNLQTKLGAAVAGLALVAAATVGAPSASAAQNTLPVKNLAAKNAKFTEMAGASPLSTDKTVAHWSGKFTDPTNNVTYGYTMVGADPSANGSTTTPTDVIPLDLAFSASNGYALNGTDVVDRTSTPRSSRPATTAPLRSPVTTSPTPAVASSPRATPACSTRTRSCGRSSTRSAPATT